MEIWMRAPTDIDTQARSMMRRRCIIMECDTMRAGWGDGRALTLAGSAMESMSTGLLATILSDSPTLRGYQFGMRWKHLHFLVQARSTALVNPSYRAWWELAC